MWGAVCGGGMVSQVFDLLLLYFLVMVVLVSVRTSPPQRWPYRTALCWDEEPPLQPDLHLRAHLTQRRR